MFFHNVLSKDCCSLLLLVPLSLGIAGTLAHCYIELPCYQLDWSGGLGVHIVSL
jgi:hypothetical protein